jgi:hypothetical protein
MNRTIESGSRDEEWNVSGTDPQIAANWADLEGSSGKWDVSTNTDWHSVLDRLAQDFQNRPIVIQIVAGAFG